MRLSGASLAEELANVRHRIAEWVAGMTASPDVVEDVVLAANEALANVADHAYPDGTGDAWVELERRSTDELVVVVADRGRWRPPPADPGFRGHGLTLIKGLADRVAIRHSPAGTTVEMAWSLRPLSS
ncbi:ATP-binding protein [Pseudonocardia sp. TRM90224]|uniref:ATP-binding protein n=1 Tax=Pseudonocardia sp. TRM90224 TaxID=2812678 RepID=UPI001E28F61A|nr:ATP-binding protein [Pseudonocardia sp. TRM90224]